MNDNARNTRTLIVSFVFAIMALIPLRFVEVGQMMESQPQVLGEEQVLPVEDENAIPVLEEPYNEIDATSCVPVEQGKAKIAEYEEMLTQGGLDGATTDRIVTEMMGIESGMCK